jgi:hypothetical protein
MLQHFVERQAEGEVGKSMDFEHAASARTDYITAACMRKQGRHGRAQADNDTKTTSGCQTLDAVASGSRVRSGYRSTQRMRPSVVMLSAISPKMNHEKSAYGSRAELDDTLSSSRREGVKRAGGPGCADVHGRLP